MFRTKTKKSNVPMLAQDDGVLCKPLQHRKCLSTFFEGQRHGLHLVIWMKITVTITIVKSFVFDQRFLH